MKKFLKEYSIITLGGIIVASAIFMFMLPSNLAVGSGSAIAMILSNFIPLPVSALALILNIILLILGFIFIGREFGGKTVYVAILIPVVMGVYEIILPNFKSLTEDPLLDLICYILVSGIGMAVLFSLNASSGGLDIVAKIMSKYLKMDVGYAMSVSGLVVAFSSAICYDTKTVVLSVLGTYFGGMIVDKFIFGLNIKRRVCIISEKLDDIVKFVINDLHSGATLYEIIGAYDNTPRKEVIVIVDKQEYRRLMDYVTAIDPAAFVTVYAVNTIMYRPKKKA